MGQRSVNFNWPDTTGTSGGKMRILYIR